MQTFINPVSCRYGAPLGRYTGPDILDTAALFLMLSVALPILT